MDQEAAVESLIVTIEQLEAKWVCANLEMSGASPLAGMIEALGDFSSERSIDALVDRIDSAIWSDGGTDRDDSYRYYPVRKAACKALVRVGEPAVDRLLTLLSNKERRWAAVPILAQIGGLRASEQLMGALARAEPGDWAFSTHIIRQLPRLSGSRDEKIRIIDIFIRDLRRLYRDRQRERDRWEKDGRRGAAPELIDRYSFDRHLAEADAIRRELLLTASAP